MKLLLDTCTFLRVPGCDPALSPMARAAFAAPDNEVYLSPVSTWEILVKHGLGRIELPAPADRFLTQQRGVGCQAWIGGHPGCIDEADTVAVARPRKSPSASGAAALHFARPAPS